MSWLEDMPVTRKILIVVMVVCVLTLLLFSVSIGTYQVLAFKASTSREIATLADVLGVNSSAALIFRDVKTAEETLDALRAVPDVRAAVLYDRQGAPFATYRSPRPSSSSLFTRMPEAEGIQSQDGDLVIHTFIFHGGDRIGSVAIQTDMGGLYGELRHTAAIILGITCASALLAFLLIARLQRLITHPIRELAATARTVSATRDYTLRAVKHGNDEIGVLAEGLNAMLHEVHLRNTELQQARDQLEERVTERTRELEQEVAIRQIAERRQGEALAKLEAANKELNDFAYIVSHDLKAPLRAIGSLAEWISVDYGDKLGPDGKEKINLMLTRTKRMHDLINGILQFSRVGRVKDGVIDSDLNVLIKDVIDMIAPPPHVEVFVQKNLPSVRCERTHLIQVFQNLLSNAVKYMDKPKGVIKVSCTDEGPHWQFVIRDNGPGIDRKYFEKIFQLFQTLAPRDRSESTGVGLALVKKIVGLWGGSVWVESDVGRGTSFVFTMPKVIADALAHPA